MSRVKRTLEEMLEEEYKRDTDMYLKEEHEKDIERRKELEEMDVERTIKVFETSDKIKNIYKDASKYKHRLFEGAVRSGKSYTANQIALIEIEQLDKKAKILLSGTNSGTVKQNVIGEWEELLGVEFVMKSDLKGDYFFIPYKGFEGKKFYIRGHDKNNDEKKIQGMTLSYWYVDEATNMTQNFFNMAVSRLSLDESKSIMTCNPDSPHHYLKKDFIDKVEEKTSFNYYSFSMSDNPSLTDSYMEELEEMYDGVFYDRFILGKWVIAEGLIYRKFNRNRHIKSITNKEKMRLKRDPRANIYIGVDYGSYNATTFLKFVEISGVYYLIEEFFHSGRDNVGNERSTSQYANDMVNFIGKDVVKSIFIDPSASGFIFELRGLGVSNIMKAKNTVLPGIQSVENLFESNKLIISDVCIYTIKELETYSWDEIAAARGEDKPLKVNDHCMDSLRYAIYSTTHNKVSSGNY